MEENKVEFTESLLDVKTPNIKRCSKCSEQSLCSVIEVELIKDKEKLVEVI